MLLALQCGVYVRIPLVTGLLAGDSLGGGRGHRYVSCQCVEAPLGTCWLHVLVPAHGIRSGSGTLERKLSMEVCHLWEVHAHMRACQLCTVCLVEAT